MKTITNEWISLEEIDQILHENTKLTLAEEVKKLCEACQATFIINDKVDLAIQMDAHGVHLGLNDMRIKNARSILGDHKIIGGTANTLQDILNHVSDKADYIGLGPFRFTRSFP